MPLLAILGRCVLQDMDQAVTFHTSWTTYPKDGQLHKPERQPADNRWRSSPSWTEIGASSHLYGWAKVHVWKGKRCYGLCQTDGTCWLIYHYDMQPQVARDCGHLLPGQKSLDRPDLVARVFHRNKEKWLLCSRRGLSVECRHCYTQLYTRNVAYTHTFSPGST